MGKSIIANISARNKYQPIMHAANAKPPPIWMFFFVSIYMRNLIEGSSHNLVILVSQEVGSGCKKVTSGNEAEGTLETDENQDIYDIGPDRADEHDEIEDCHE